MSRSQPFTPLGCSVTSSFPSLPLSGHSPSAFEYSIKGRERSNAGKDDGEGAVNASSLELRAKTPLGSEQLCRRGRPRARTSPGCPPDGCWEARGCVRFIPLCVSVSLPCLSGGVGLLGTETQPTWAFGHCGSAVRMERGGPSRLMLLREEQKGPLDRLALSQEEREGGPWGFRD